MKIKYLLIALVMMCLLVLALQARARDYDIFTTLVIIEESENGTLMTGNTFFADGIYDQLWNMNDYIFFNMPLDKPIKKVKNTLDIKPYLEIARSSGADSVLLIKFDYSSKEEGRGLRIKTNEISYNLYSLNTVQSLKTGKKRYGLNKVIDKTEKEYEFTKLGNDIIADIFK